MSLSTQAKQKKIAKKTAKRKEKIKALKIQQKRIMDVSVNAAACSHDHPHDHPHDHIHDHRCGV